MANATVNSSVVDVSGTSVDDALTLAIITADGFICASGLIGNALVIYVISRSSFKSKTVTTNTFIVQDRHHQRLHTQRVVQVQERSSPRQSPPTPS